MRVWLLGVIGVLAAALVGWSCAAGSELPPAGDGGTGDTPAQTDVPWQPDSEPQVDAASDGPADGAQHDGQADGPPQADVLGQADRSQQDGACTAQNTGACDVVCQNCGGQKCSMDPTNHQLAACMANGTAGPGAACTGDSNGDNCVAGFVCLSEAKCIQYCRTDGDCLAYNGACILGISWGGTTPFKACKNPDNCNPVANTGCTSGGCFLWANDLQTFCLTAGTGGDGTACPNGNECKGGFVCVGSGPADYKCRQVCLKATPVCSATYSCQTLQGFTTYGFCA